MRKTLSNLIFDFDGVLVNSMHNNFSAWKKALSDFNSSIDEKEYFLLEGATPKAIAERYTKPGTNIEAVVKLKEQAYNQGPKSEIYFGVIEFLTSLKERNIALGVVSGGGRTRVENALKEYGIYNFFNCIVTADDVANGKPDPEPYLRAIAMLGCDPKESYVIENAPLGIQSAKDAGLPVIALGTTLSEEHLGKADYYCKDHPAFFELISQILEKNS